VSKPVRTNPFADEDIFNQTAYYAARSIDLGGELWNEIEAIFHLISDYPLIGEVVRRARVRGTARRIPLRHFPFFVIYRIHDDFIEVMALAHTSRKPNFWRGRFN
jgi:toxin ParE1/3/4